ncbi:lytic murein transglycosylase B, partial [Xanthomonas sp. Kuri4-1]
MTRRALTCLLPLVLLFAGCNRAPDPAASAPPPAETPAA